MDELESLQGIFKDRLFRIPDYQRGYAWSKGQLSDFWEDILILPPERIHYTGQLALKEVGSNVWKNWIEERWMVEDRGYKPFYVVDGQQRLTTAVIFIHEIVSFIRQLPENKEKPDEEIYLGTFSIKQIKEDYLFIRKPPQFIISTFKFGYENDNPSFKYLRYRILGEPGGGSIQETFYTLNLENAKRFFEGCLSDYYKEHGRGAIELLLKKTTQNLKFNILEIQDELDVFIAFETMNYCGKPLSKLELLKNRLIYLTTLYSDYELKNDEKTKLRKNINDAWKEIYYQLGRNKQKPLSDDDFLVAHWIMYFQYSRKQGKEYIHFLLNEKFTQQNVFSKTEPRIDSIIEVQEIHDEEREEEENSEDETEEKISIQAKLSPKEINDYVESLKSAAHHWYNTWNPLNNPDLNPEETIWLDRLNRIGIAYFRPLVTASFICRSVTSGDRVKLFKEIERFIFIAFRLSRALSTFRNTEYYSTARLLLNDKITVDQICTLLKNRIENWLKPETGFDHLPFKTYLQRLYKNGGGYYEWSGLRYFLYEYEESIVHELGNPKIDWTYFVKSEKDKVSIEHIYPQTPSNEYWQKAFDNYSIDDQKYLAGSLGNLLPLSSSINSSLQNDSFPDKKAAKVNERGEKLRRGYSDGSHSEIEVAGYPEWDSNTILDRGLKLLTFMEKRWNIKFKDEESKKD
jgi:uncharacterized protein with ParB-like and HNH nuclease domain